MTTGRDIIVLADGRCDQHGVDFGQSDPHLIGIHEKNKIMAIHQKGTNYWGGIGQTNYAESVVTIYSFEKIEKEGRNLRISGLKKLIEYHPTRKEAVRRVQDWFKEQLQLRSGHELEND